MTPTDIGTTDIGAATAHGSCPLCALPRTRADIAGFGWSSQHERDGSVTWICPTCTRAQLWRIEAMLPVATSTAPAALPITPAA